MSLTLTETPARWRPVPGFELLYEVSDLGQVRRIGSRQGTKTGRVLANKLNRDGYVRVSLCNAPNPQVSKFVHILVLEAFVGPCPAGMEACHEDGNPGNAALSNLRWGTPKSNAADRKRHGTTARGERHGQSKLTDEQIEEIRAATDSQRSIARRFGISQQHVSEIKRGLKRTA